MGTTIEIFLLIFFLQCYALQLSRNNNYNNQQPEK
jgi:hypothetical protein